MKSGTNGNPPTVTLNSGYKMPILGPGTYSLQGDTCKNVIFNKETIARIANAQGVASAQVVLRWHLQRGVVAIPGSSNPAQIPENISVFGFELTETEMRAITELDRNEKHDWY